MKPREPLQAKWVRRLLLTIYFGVTSLVFTWPLAAQMTDSVIGQLGDNMHFAWMIGWFERALVQLHVSPLFAPQLNYPAGWNLARSELAIVQSILGIPPSLLKGPVFAYNLVAILSFAFTGLAGYYWVKRVSGDTLAGILAGSAFAFAPYRIAHLRAGHLNLLGTSGLPLFFMGFLSVLTGSSDRKDVVVGGLGLGLVAISSQYYLYFTLVAAALVYLVHLLIGRERGWLARTYWRSLVTMAAVAAPLVALGTLPYLQLASRDRLPDRSIQSLSAGSASVSDFLLPSTDHFLLGKWVGDSFSRDHWTEGTLYLGVVSTGLAIVAVAGGSQSQRELTIRLSVLLVVAAVLALGTHLYWNEQLVRVALPKPLTGLLGRETTAIPMPDYLLVRVIPFFAKLRAFKRAGALALLAVATLAGIGAARVRARAGGRRGSVLLVLLTALVLFDFYPGPFEQLTQVRPRAVDSWLASQPDKGAVAEFPFSLEQEQVNVFYTLTHGKPFLGGFFNAFPPPQYLRIQPVMAGFPDQASVATLRELGVHYILVEASAYPDVDGLRTELAAMNAAFVVNMDGELVFVLP